MSYEVDDHRLLTPVDHEAPRRMKRLRELGLGPHPDREFDDFARKLAQTTGSPFAMVNLISSTEQYFAGLYLHNSPVIDPAIEAGEVTTYGQPGRVMALDHGFCPDVVSRRKALVLEDVCSWARFAGNPVVDKLGIRSYLGAPLIDRTGTALGTICVVDTEPRPWGHPGLGTIKRMASEMIDLIHRRESMI